MQQSDFEGIKRSGAVAREREVSYFDNPHHDDKDEHWLMAATAWSSGWREADKGRSPELAMLDQVRYR